jgi:hypothetical protein
MNICVDLKRLWIPSVEPLCVEVVLELRFESRRVPASSFTFAGNDFACDNAWKEDKRQKNAMTINHRPGERGEETAL